MYTCSHISGKYGGVHTSSISSYDIMMVNLTVALYDTFVFVFHEGQHYIKKTLLPHKRTFYTLYYDSFE